MTAPPNPPSIREHAEHALVDLQFGYTGEAMVRLRAIIDALNAAEADLFDEDVGMVALIPDGAAWHLVPGKGWMRLVPDGAPTQPNHD